MNTNLTTDPISYDGWTKEWSTKYNVNYWYNSKTDVSVWEDPVWKESIDPQLNKPSWINKITGKKVFNNPWLPVPKSPEMPPPPPVPFRPLDPPAVEWGAKIYDRPTNNSVDPLDWGVEESKSEEQIASQQVQAQQPPLISLDEIFTQDTEEEISQSTTDPKKQLEYIVSHYLKNKNNLGRNVEFELEGRFGTKGKNITRIQFNNVITKLLSVGFQKTSEEYRLSSSLQHLNKKLGLLKYSSIRPEIKNLNTIQKFCKEDDINSISTSNPEDITFNEKNLIYVKQGLNGGRLSDATFDDFNFSVSCKTEKKLPKKDTRVQQISNDWSNTKKKFRYMSRITYEHPEYPSIKFDLSIVRSTTTATYKISDSNIFSTPEKFEIEFEIVNDKIGNMSSQVLIALIHKMSTHVLCGLQGTNFPISNEKQDQVLLKSYMKIIFPDPERTFTHAYPNNFIGPSPCTLQRANIKPIDSLTNEPNIRQNYSVTDKADGERYLMLIDHDGHIYLINQGMNVIFTGALTKNEKLFNTIIDGELIVHDKNKKFINLFAAFDIYYINNTKVRHFPLMKTDAMEVPTVITEEKAARDKKTLYRYDLLQEAIHTLKPVSVIKDKESPMQFTVKTFYVPTNGQNIFDCCRTILDTQNTMQYLCDGLIFTPTLFGVGSNQPNKDGKNKTWDLLLKWKPASLNTIDFLVETLKDPSGQDTISSVFRDGDPQIHQFKTLVLKCGFNENIDGYINPCLDIINGVKNDVEKEDHGKYKPMQFYPSKPYNNKAGLCNIMVKSNEFRMYTKNAQNQDDEIFEDDMIVEFRFDKAKYDAENVLSWVPIRIRYDKTEEYRKAKLDNEFKGPNSYRTANDNWYSINYPITEEMIKTGEITGENVEVESSEEVYYKNGNRNTSTRGLRDFHNLFVKNLLITSVSYPGNTLIDYACGKGGDLPKWNDARLSFVFGIDISSDNLENRLNGSCARYLNYRKTYSNAPDALFVTGDSSKNIRDGSASSNELSKKITSAVFGKGEKNEDYLGRGVYKHFGDGSDGFNVSSCQFALHYFFKTSETLHNFIRNLAECTRLNGYFIGTCYDGQSVFNLLKKYTYGEGPEYYNDRVKICRIIKNYSDEYQALEGDESCIGKEILVWQDSINQMIPEYLVNFNYLVRIMENYGFVLQPPPNSNLKASDLFKQLFYKMNQEVELHNYKYREFRNALNMSNAEKDVSFLNRYFIFQKVREVDAAKIAIQFIERIQPNEEYQGPTLDVRPLQNSLVLKADSVKSDRKTRVKDVNAQTLPVAPAAAPPSAPAAAPPAPVTTAVAEVEQLEVETAPIVVEPEPVVLVRVENPIEPKKRGRPKKIVEASAAVESEPANIKQTKPKTKKNVVQDAVEAVKQSKTKTKKNVAAVELSAVEVEVVVAAPAGDNFEYEIDGVIQDLMSANLTKEEVIREIEKRLKIKLTAAQKKHVSERGRVFGYTWR
jgi:hypothetical protein